jgi:hypothetical protein
MSDDAAPAATEAPAPTSDAPSAEPAAEVLAEPEPAPPPPPEPLDPRAEKIRDELAELLRAGLGSWEKAVDSQNRLSGLIKELGVEMAEIKEWSATPVFRGGMPLLESAMSRAQACRRRLGAVGGRLKKLEANIQAQKLQKQRQAELQKARAAKAAGQKKAADKPAPPPKAPEKPTKTEGEAAPPTDAAPNPADVAPPAEPAPPADAAPNPADAAPPPEQAPAEEPPADGATE